MKQSICRDRDSLLNRERERREDNRDIDNKVAQRNTSRDARKNAQRDTYKKCLEILFQLI